MKVRHIVAAICVFSLTGMAVIANEPNEAKEVETDFEPLSKRFLAALQSEQIDEALACWLPAEQLADEFAKSLPPGEPKPSPEEIAEAAKYFQKRDETVRERLPKFLAALKADGLDPGKLSYSSSKAIFSRRNGKKSDVQATMIYVVFEAEDGSKARFEIDDGYRLNGIWYFMDEPLHLWLVRDGEEKLVPLFEFNE